MSMPSRSILFADDDVLTQWIMTDVLTQAGFTVTSVCRGLEAIELVDTSCGFDLLLTDLDLPDNVTGHELGNHWREVLPGCPVIYTGIKRGHSVRILEQHEYYVEKPFNADRLLRTIDWALEDAVFRPFFPAYARRSQHAH